METTKLLVEYLVAGTITLIAIIAMALSVAPGQMQILFDKLGQLSPTVATELVVSVAAGAIAYATGIVSEYIGEQCFEWEIQLIKEKRITKFLKDNNELVKESRIFKTALQKHQEGTAVKNAEKVHGTMRFYVMHRSEQLYAEIAKHISRFRLIRVTFIVEIMFAIAIVWQLIVSSPKWMWWVALLGTVAITTANYFAITRRIERYCSAVERSFLTLCYEEVASLPPNRSS